ncbi:hypothetical protein BKG75_06760 [Mycobacteroides chelonae]|nr:hypothetical protein DYE20_20160 [[Mycobacterium] chelonae subsp. gwanakae]OHU14895.1 hypothetical protein BKG75_06760 [Mycobacteroides chelonae]
MGGNENPAFNDPEQSIPGSVGNFQFVYERTLIIGLQPPPFIWAPEMTNLAVAFKTRFELGFCAVW